MKVLIKQNASRWGSLNTKPGKNTHEFLKQNAGKWLTVDTDHLFNNQYNVEGFRIYDADIQAIKEDPRGELLVCKYCGKMFNKTEYHFNDTECLIYGFEELKNSFFINHPNGPDPIKEINLYTDHKKTGVYSLYSVNGLYTQIIFLSHYLLV